MKRSFGAHPLVYPMPAFLIGSYDAEGKANLMTAAWGGICCSEPLLLAVSVQKVRWTHEAVLQRKAFTIGIPSVKLALETDYAGIVSGRREDKFARLGLTPVRSELVDAPYAAECPVVLELALAHHFDLGLHTQFIGEIKDVKIEESCLDAAGNPDIAKIDPLVFDFGGRAYHTVGAEVCKAFSAGKAFLKKN